MKLSDIIRTTKHRIIFLGIIPLVQEIDQCTSELSHILELEHDATLTILYESENELFQIASSLRSKKTKNFVPFSVMRQRINRISGKGNIPGIKEEILKKIRNNTLRTSAEKRIFIRQTNLKIPFNLMIVDENIWQAFITHNLPKLQDYIKIDHKIDTRFISEIENYLEFLIKEKEGNVYLSKPDEELIWVYDSEAKPRGVFPRASFYTTDYGRYVVWILVFNRNGELLLQRRNMRTNDNRGLWDKSIGGHVDLSDVSTAMTAKRELIEEMYLPDAEYTKYLAADFGDIVDYGEWNLRKRTDRSFRSQFKSLGPYDWILFRSTDNKGLPLTIKRVSERTFHHMKNNKEVLSIRKTIFHADTFFAIAPKGELDDNETIKINLTASTKKGVISEYKLTTISELDQWIKEEGTNNFTDDILSIIAEYREMLEQISEFIKYSFECEVA